MTNIQNLDLNNKKVLLRTDLNVEVRDGVIVEDYKIKAERNTIDFLIEKGAKIILLSHINDTDSFKELVGQISTILGREIGFIEDYRLIKDIIGSAQAGSIFLLENIRKWPEEEKNNEAFAKELADGFDYYINDAFSVCHRAHASVSAITKHVQSFAGPMLLKEIENLSKVINEPASGKTIIFGGSKISTKAPVIKNFLDKAEHILIGGALANVFFKKQGIDVGKSLVDEVDVLDGFNWNDEKIVLPKDIIVSEDKSGNEGAIEMELRDLGPEQMILDVGTQTIGEFLDIIRNSKMVIFNGPLGLVESEMFAKATKAISQAIIDSEAFSVIGGGDTIAILNKFGILDKFDYVSVAGGAMLEFLSGQELPGLKALGI